MATLFQQYQKCLEALKAIEAQDPGAATEESMSSTTEDWRHRCREQSRIARVLLHEISKEGPPAE